jgi:hypothetical protein
MEDQQVREKTKDKLFRFVAVTISFDNWMSRFKSRVTGPVHSLEQFADIV